ncbi:MAG: YceI family protein [Pseudomonadota bacterium]
MTGPRRGLARTAFLAASLLTVAFLSERNAAAADFVADPAASALDFVYERAGNPAEGRFLRFSGAGRFDPEAVQATTLRLQIETASIELGNRLESAFATSVEWFDSKTYPVADYRLLSLSPLGDGRYDTRGVLRIKERSMLIQTPIRLAMENGRAIAEGALSIDRRAFGLGIGPISAFVTIGDRVEVRFRLVADARPGSIGAEGEANPTVGQGVD